MSRRKPFTFEINETNCFICISHYRDKDGYAQFKINRKIRAVHRYIYEECYGPIPQGKVIRHTCDNPKCINPEHLVVGEHKDNILDRVKRNRSAKGEHNGRAKLTPENIREIRRSNLSYRQLARKFNVDHKLIGNIKKRKIWKHIA